MTNVTYYVPADRAQRLAAAIESARPALAARLRAGAKAVGYRGSASVGMTTDDARALNAVVLS